MLKSFDERLKGNFGSLYRFNTWMRNNIVTWFPKNPIIFFPQTINYNKSSDYIASDDKIFSGHKKLTLTLRSNDSYQFAEEHFKKTKKIFVPDAAFMLGDIKVIFFKPFPRKVLL
jgi:pyruvyl transferase EpsI